jgi:hypothetical protein
MDSLSQLALGASVGMAVMGRRTALWKSAAWGAVAGTLPDLDVVIDHGDALLNMVLHRAESHALLYLTLLAPLSHVAPAREVSMLFAALIGGRLLGEGDRALRLAGAACIAVGVIALAWT